MSRSPQWDREATVDILVASVADRPELGQLMADVPDGWPEFMYHDPFADLLYEHATTRYASTCMVAIDPERPQHALATSYGVPISVGLDDLPESGWDGAMLIATNDQLAGVRGSLFCGLEITVRPDLRRAGMAKL